MSHYKRSQYVDLKVNGRLFQSYILANFAKYKIPEEILSSSEDPCQKSKDAKLELKKYQTFVSQYMSPDSPYNSILLYHTVGSGKSATAINVYNMMYNATSGINVIYLSRATLIKSTFIPELELWLAMKTETIA